MSGHDKTVPVTRATLEEAAKQGVDLAIAAGARVIKGSAWKLMLDIDDALHEQQFYAGFTQLHKTLPIMGFRSWPSKSGIGIHVIVYLDKQLTPHEIITWQLFLGSDPNRERWNMARIITGILQWNKLFKPKAAIGVYGRCPILLWCKNCERLQVLSNKRYLDELHNADCKWRCISCGCSSCVVLEA